MDGMAIKGKHVAYAAQNFWQTILIGALGMWVMVAIGNATDRATTPGAKRALEVRELYFENGNFHQIVVPKGIQTINATWAAQIKKGNEWVCGGGDIAPYEPRTEPSIMDPTEWAGSDCSEMVVGDLYTAYANWEWRDESGFIQSIAKSFEFIYIEGPGL